MANGDNVRRPVATHMTPAEKYEVAQAADLAMLSVSTFIRLACIEKARAGK